MTLKRIIVLSLFSIVFYACNNNIDENLKNYLENNQHAFSLVIRITEELKNVTENNLYNEMLEINNLTVISEAEIDTDLDLDVEN